jgi:NADPH2:quinone reductase
MAAAFANGDAARVLAIVRNARDAPHARAAGADQVLLVSEAGELLARVRELAPGGIDRIIDVAFSTYLLLYPQIVAQGAVIATYFSPDPAPRIPFYPLLFQNAVLRLLGSDEVQT